MAGMDLIGGSVRPFSQFRMVQGTTPSLVAASFWVSPILRRLFLTCSPKVFGSKSYGFGINDLSNTGTNGKKAMNPCLCGMAGDDSGRCNCSAEQIQRYRSRISGPLLDRIDIQMEVTRPKKSILSESSKDGENSATVRARVIAARKRQLQRAGKANALMDNGDLGRFCHLQQDSLELLEQAAEQLYLSPRACHRILKVARTVADLDRAEDIACKHIAEATALRCLQISDIGA